ncbi:hypothetical protein SDC9_116808 [bioreactor metagenome]|uniref:Uncharacterized protein n=1 Tax=bioreactor metagenome TaxID=1076179 RepID=A0A645BWM6_9ZZZZ
MNIAQHRVEAVYQILRCICQRCRFVFCVHLGHRGSKVTLRKQFDPLCTLFDRVPDTLGNAKRNDPCHNQGKHRQYNRHRHADISHPHKVSGPTIDPNTPSIRIRQRRISQHAVGPIKLVAPDTAFAFCHFLYNRGKLCDTGVGLHLL